MPFRRCGSAAERLNLRFQTIRRRARGYRIFEPLYSMRCVIVVEEQVAAPDSGVPQSRIPRSGQGSPSLPL
jgi:hypothetical protein